MCSIGVAASVAASNKYSEMDILKKRALVYMDTTKRFISLTCRKIWKVGQDDPRRAIHSLKVGLSLTLVSLLYLLEPLFKGVGENVIWAVMTVVVVLEFTAGKKNSSYFAKVTIYRKHTTCS